MKKVIAIAFAIIALETLYLIVSPYVAASAQSMFRANLERTGVYKTRSIQRLHGVKWKFKTERVIEAWFSSPTVSGDTVYFGSHDGYLYSIDAQTGKQRWSFKTGYRVYSSPAVSEGTIYFGSADNYLYAVE